MDQEKLLSKCDFCEKSFFDEQILGLHIKSNHRSIIEGWKKCNLCDKTYDSKKSFLKDVKTNASVKGYECETCTKVLTFRYWLQTITPF